MSEERDLCTREEYDGLRPLSQGYLAYWEGDHPGSELKGFKNPYDKGTAEYAEWDQGGFAAMLDAQDSED